MAPKNKNKRPAEATTTVEQAPAKRSKSVNGTASSTDALQWKEVEMPDVLDDVEGFFGLEEVDGVDVVVTSSGKVEYKVGFPLRTARTYI